MKKLTWLIGSIVGISSVFSVACGDDDDDTNNDSGGTAGTAGKGGSSGRGGTAGKGGSAGTAGSSSGRGGTAGTAGTSNAGRGGTAGTAGTSTTGGTSGEAGGGGASGEAAQGGGGAGAGEAGEAGEGGTGGVPAAGAAGEAGMAGAGGEGPLPLTCSEIPSQAAGDSSFTVTVTGFANCEPIPAAHTCEAKPFPQGTSPAISWTAGPTGTMSYALVFKDLSIISSLDPSDPLYNRGFHYVMWDIPSSVTSLPADMDGGSISTDVEGARQWSNFNDYGWFGPCPNFDPELPATNNDSYAFTLYALPTQTAEILAPTTGISTVRQLDNAFKAAALAIAEYRGTSNAHANEIPDGVLPPTATPPCPTDGSPLDGCQPGPS